MSPLIIKVFPEHGHPSSLWPSPELVKVKTRAPFVLPSELGLNEPDGKRILSWTEDFQGNFHDYGTSFDERPTWNEHFDVWAWYTEGYRIVELLSSEFPQAFVKPRFSRYVFATNEIRHNAGLPPVQMPGMNLPGHVDINTLGHSSQ